MCVTLPASFAVRFFADSPFRSWLHRALPVLVVTFHVAPRWPLLIIVNLVGELSSVTEGVHVAYLLVGQAVDICYTRHQIDTPA